MKLINTNLLVFSIFTTATSPIISDEKQDLRHYKINENTQLIIEKGDITKSHVQAIVNAANPQLLGGAGVCGAIFNAAGWHALQEACNKFPELNGSRCPVGQTRITRSFNLASQGIDYIIHAVGPDCRIIHDEHQQNVLLENTYRNALILAEQNNISSLSFPFISSAIYAFPKERAARIAIKTIFEFAKNKDKIRSIHFVLFSQDDFDLFCKIAKEFSN